MSGSGSSGAFRESFEKGTGGLAARAKSISMRTSDHGDIQGKLAAILKGEWCAKHDKGENELVKSLLGLSRAGLFLSISGFLWGVVE